MIRQRRTSQPFGRRGYSRNLPSSLNSRSRKPLRTPSHRAIIPLKPITRRPFG